MNILLNAGFNVTDPWKDIVGAETQAEVIGRIRGAPDTIVDFFKMILPIELENCQMILGALALLLGVIVLFRILKD